MGMAYPIVGTTDTSSTVLPAIRRVLVDGRVVRIVVYSSGRDDTASASPFVWWNSSPAGLANIIAQPRAPAPAPTFHERMKELAEARGCWRHARSAEAWFQRLERLGLVRPVRVVVDPRRRAAPRLALVRRPVRTVSAVRPRWCRWRRRGARPRRYLRG